MEIGEKISGRKVSGIIAKEIWLITRNSVRKSLRKSISEPVWDSVRNNSFDNLYIQLINTINMRYEDR